MSCHRYSWFWIWMVILLLFYPNRLRRELIKLYSNKLPVSMNLVRSCLLLVGEGYWPFMHFIKDVPNARHGRIVNCRNKDISLTYGLRSSRRVKHHPLLFPLQMLIGWWLFQLTQLSPENWAHDIITDPLWHRNRFSQSNGSVCAYGTSTDSYATDESCFVHQQRPSRDLQGARRNPRRWYRAWAGAGEMREIGTSGYRFLLFLTRCAKTSSYI